MQYSRRWAILPISTKCCGGVERVFVCLFVCLFFFGFLGTHMWHMEVSRLGVKLELQLPAYTTATATWDLSFICDLHHSSQQGQILNPLSEARDRTRKLSHDGNSNMCFHNMVL